MNKVWIVLQEGKIIQMFSDELAARQYADKFQFNQFSKPAYVTECTVTGTISDEEVNRVRFEFVCKPSVAHILFMEGYSIKDFKAIDIQYGDDGTDWVLTKLDGTKVAINTNSLNLIPVSEAGRRN